MGECRSVQRSLVAYLDGEVDAVRERRVEGHVRTCSRCQGELEQFRQATLLLRKSLAPPHRSEEDWRQGLARAKRRIAALRHARRPFLEFWQRLLEDPLLAFATTILIFLALAEALTILELEEEALTFLASYFVPLVLG